MADFDLTDVADPPPAPPAGAPPPAPPPAVAAGGGVLRSPLEHLYAMSEKYRVDPELALAVIRRESSGRQTGSDGLTLQGSPTAGGQRAQGFFQLLPKTAYGEFKLDPTDPFQNIEAGVRYLRQGIEQGDGTVKSVLSYYHGGSNKQMWGPKTAEYAQAIEDDLRRRLASQPADAPAATPADAPAPRQNPQGFIGPLPQPPTPPKGFDEQHPYLADLDQAIQGKPMSPASSPLDARRQADTYTGVNFLREATPSLNPVNIAKGVQALFTTHESPTEKTLSLDPRPVLQAMWDANAKLRDEGRKLMDEARGQHDFSKSLEGLGRIAEGMIPIFGPRIADADKWARQGEYAKAAGAAVDVAGQVVGPSQLESTHTPRLFKPRLTDAEQAAVDFGLRARVGPEKMKVPIDVATASGSDFARGTQRSVESTPLGGVVHEAVKYGRKKALPALGDQLADQVHPVPVTPEQAGAGIRSGVEDYIANQHQVANTSYDTLRQIEQDPALARSVQVRMSNGYNSAGQLVPVPVMETMPLPAAVMTAKPTLQALYDRVMQTMPLAQREASPGLQALKQILDGPDHVPASVLDRNLSAIKELARGADMPQLRSASQGLAAKAVSELEKVHADAIQRAGPQAQQALAAGRAATKAKWAAQEVLDRVIGTQGEPVGAFKGATLAGDAAIEHLRDLQRLAPNEMPKIGRAVLESIFDHAGGLEQGWSRADAVVNKWAALGTETKKILYGAGAADLDSFFLLQKMLARSPNPSGTALTLLTAGSGYALATHPLASAGATLGSGAMAALMNSRLGVRLLTQGLKIPAGTAAAAAWAVSIGEQLRKMHQDVGLPPPSQTTEPPPAPGWKYTTKRPGR